MSYGLNFENFYNPFPFYVDNNGNPIVGATLTFYQSGTLNLLATYSDPDFAPEHQNPNPMVSGENGYFTAIYLQPLPYKVILTYPDGQEFERDPVGGMASIPYPIASTDSSVKFVASGYGAISSDWGKTLATTTQTTTLNLQSGWTNGWNVTIKNAYIGPDGGPITVTIGTTNGAKIDNSTDPYVLFGRYTAINFIYDGTNFWSRNANQESQIIASGQNINTTADQSSWAITGIPDIALTDTVDITGVTLHYSVPGITYIPYVQSIQAGTGFTIALTSGMTAGPTYPPVINWVVRRV